MKIKEWFWKKEINRELKGCSSREDLVRALEGNEKLKNLLGEIEKNDKNSSTRTPNPDTKN